MKVPNKVLKGILAMARGEKLPLPNESKDVASKDEIVQWAQAGIDKRSAPPAPAAEA